MGGSHRGVRSHRVRTDDDGFDDYKVGDETDDDDDDDGDDEGGGYEYGRGDGLLSGTLAWMRSGLRYEEDTAAGGRRQGCRKARASSSRPSAASVETDLLAELREEVAEDEGRANREPARLLAHSERGRRANSGQANPRRFIKVTFDWDGTQHLATLPLGDIRSTSQCLEALIALGETVVGPEITAASSQVWYATPSGESHKMYVTRTSLTDVLEAQGILVMRKGRT